MHLLFDHLVRFDHFVDELRCVRALQSLAAEQLYLEIFHGLKMR